MKELTWKNVLYPHCIIGHIGKMRETAWELAYPYFSWNGRIYETKTGEQTEFLNEDVK